MSKPLKLIWALFAIALLVSCASSEVQQKSFLKTPLEQYRTVQIFGDSRDTGVWDTVEEVCEEAKEEIEDLELFDSVTIVEEPTPTPRGLCLELLVHNVRSVSLAERLATGPGLLPFIPFGAPRNSLEVEVSFRDASTGEEVGAYNVSGEAGTTGVNRGMGTAIDEAVEEIVKIIRDEYAE